MVIAEQDPNALMYWKLFLPFLKIVIPIMVLIGLADILRALLRQYLSRLSFDLRNRRVIDSARTIEDIKMMGLSSSSICVACCLRAKATRFASQGSVATAALT